MKWPSCKTVCNLVRASPCRLSKSPSQLSHCCLGSHPNISKRNGTSNANIHWSYKSQNTTFPDTETQQAQIALTFKIPPLFSFVPALVPWPLFRMPSFHQNPWVAANVPCVSPSQPAVPRMTQRKCIRTFYSSIWYLHFKNIELWKSNSTNCLSFYNRWLFAGWQLFVTQP